MEGAPQPCWGPHTSGTEWSMAERMSPVDILGERRAASKAAQSAGRGRKQPRVSSVSAGVETTRASPEQQELWDFLSPPFLL